VGPAGQRGREERDAREMGCVGREGGRSAGARRGGLDSAQSRGGKEFPFSYFLFLFVFLLISFFF
jgi:hypothetical protein